MNTQSAFPHRLQWTSEQIADAVPLRLFELFAFDASAAAAQPARNTPLSMAARRPWRQAYAPPRALPARVRIHS